MLALPSMLYSMFSHFLCAFFHYYEFFVQKARIDTNITTKVTGRSFLLFEKYSCPFVSPNGTPVK